MVIDFSSQPSIKITAPTTKMGLWSLTYYSHDGAIGTSAGSARSHQAAEKKARRRLEKERIKKDAWNNGETTIRVEE